METEQRDHPLIWIYRLLPIPKLQNKTGHLATPRFGLGPESALGLLPSIALSSAQVVHSYTRTETSVAFVSVKGVENLVP